MSPTISTYSSTLRWWKNFDGTVADVVQLSSILGNQRITGCKVYRPRALKFTALWAAVGPWVKFGMFVTAGMIRYDGFWHQYCKRLLDPSHLRKYSYMYTYSYMYLSSPCSPLPWQWRTAGRDKNSWERGLTVTRTAVRYDWLQQGRPGGRTDCNKDGWEGGLTVTRTARIEDWLWLERLGIRLTDMTVTYIYYTCNVDQRCRQVHEYDSVTCHKSAI